MAVKAVGKQVGISAKKLRPILNALRGKPVTEALEQLRFSPGPNAESVAAVLRSAAANAENNNALDPTRLRVVGAFADQAVRLRRFRARSRGRAGKVLRPASHITILVDEQGTVGVGRGA
ncbi:MAG: 50S ribosomal protein L22 [Chloroflexi bacterium]|nr:50S ribosomal protein L22 [Chloroflexota bacterium]MCH7655834.1 50S ribosomal protein L22 [Chloroflexota bacterium]